MVKRITKSFKWWSCSVCHHNHDRKRDAERCERKKPLKITTGKCKEWNVGDLAVLKVCEEQIYHLVRIVEIKQEEHALLPVFEFMESGKKETYSDYRYDDFVIITGDITARLRKWLEILAKASKGMK